MGSRLSRWIGCLMLITVAVMILGITGDAGAKDKEPASTDTSNYSVTVSSTFVQVPVTVVDGDGKPVANLTAGDFTLLDNGDEQKVTSFETVDLGAETAREAVRATPAARRNVIFLFDLTFTTLSGLLRAQEAVLEALDSELGAADLAGVATFSAKSGLRFLVTLTSDRNQLRGAVGGLGLDKADRLTDQLGLVYSLMSPAQALTGGEKKAAVTEALREQLSSIAQAGGRNDEARYEADVSSLTDALVAIAAGLDPVAGRKHVILLSSGFSDRLLSGDTSMEAMRTEAVAREEGEVWEADSNRTFGSSTLKRRLSMALEAIQKSDVVVDTVDTAGLRAGGAIGAAQAASMAVGSKAGAGSVSESVAESTGPAEGKASLSLIARDTGGTFHQNSNDLKKPLADISAATRYVYVLGYQPSEQEGPGEYHKLKVKLNDRKMEPAHRAGYFEPRPYEQLAPIARQLSAASFLTSSPVREDLAVKVLAQPFKQAGDKALVPVILEAANAFTTKTGEDTAVALELFGYATTPEGAVADFFNQNLGFDLTKLPPQLKGAGLRYYGVFQLPAGTYTLRFLLRNARTGHSGLLAEELVVPSFGAKDPVVLAPLFLDPETPWVLARNPNATAPNLFPFWLTGSPYIPAAGPQFDRGVKKNVCVVSYNLQDAVKAGTLNVTGQVVGPDGNPAKDPTVTLKGKDVAEDSPDQVRFVFELATAEAVSGRYELRVTVEDQSTGTKYERSAPFLIR
ncbi:MAG: VWA domain-containing protein [Candidatus Schekmanbacteria bacterium]|nr:VWA domain-containing protein [Candidatus Schekmanbacteria bacterium]